MDLLQKNNNNNKWTVLQKKIWTDPIENGTFQFNIILLKKHSNLIKFQFYKKKKIPFFEILNPIKRHS